MKKKLLASVLAAAMTLSLAACGGGAASSSAPAASSPAASSPAASQPDVSEPAVEDEAQPYIVIPEEYRSWDANGNLQQFSHAGEADKAMVASSKYEASAIGLDVLKQGGNAIDAAVAMGFALGVCEPFTSGLGGGGFMTIYQAETGDTTFLNFREVAPAASDVKQYYDEAGNFIDGSSAYGGLAVGVPGETAGLLYALEKYGTMDRESVIRPAYNLADQGWTATSYYATAVDWGYGSMATEDGQITPMGKVFLDQETGLPPVVGSVVTNKDYAKALALIIEKGRDGFYTGEVAQAVVDAVQAAGGVMTLEDLANYQPYETEPVSGNYKGYEIISSATPSSGGACFIEMCNILENFPVYEKDSVEQIHLLSEVHKMVYADRAQYMADSMFTDVPLDGLTSKDYAKKLAAKIDMEKSQEFTYDDPWAHEGNNTNGYVVVDEMGNMVAVTKTVNYYWGSGVLADGYGIVLNNQMDDFSFDPESVNVVEPGKTPLSSMSPTVVFKDGKPAMMLSAPGGNTIFSILQQLFINVVDYGMNAEEAIAANRYVTRNGKTLQYDAPDLVGGDTLAQLEAMGHELYDYCGGRFSLPSFICFDENGHITGCTEYEDEGICLDGIALGY